MDLTVLRRRWRRAAVVPTRRAHAVRGRERGRAGRRGRGTGGRASATNPRISRSPSARALRSRRSTRRSPRTDRSARSTRATSAATIGGLLATGLSGDPPPPARPDTRTGPRGALRHRGRACRQGRRTDGEERHRLRPAAAPRRIARHARRRSSQATLRCRPRAPFAEWFRTTEPPRDLFRPAAVLWDGHDVHVLLEGAPADVETQGCGDDRRHRAGCRTGAHRGRISITPARSTALAPDLTRAARAGARRSASARCTSRPIPPTHCEPRRAAHAHGGWMLREAGGNGIDGFGRPLRTRTHAADQARVRSRPASSHRAGSRCERCRRRRSRPHRSVSTRTRSSRASRAGCASRTARPTV